MGHAMIARRAGAGPTWRPDVVHAHDWLVAHPAIALAEPARRAAGGHHPRHRGRPARRLAVQPLNQQVHSVEWWLAEPRRLADHLLVGDARRGRASVRRRHSPTSPCCTTASSRGAGRCAPGDVAAAGRRTRPHGAPLLLFFGRLEWEKGVQDLIAALPRIRRAHPGTRLLVAGRGTQTELLQSSRPASTGCARPVDVRRTSARQRLWRRCSRGRRRRAAQPLRTVRHRRAGSGRRRNARWSRRPPAGWARWCWTG